MTYLLQIHIGPVQAFIAAARRTRDLWFGSWVLSELSKAAAQEVAEREGVNQLVFPAPQRIDELGPNSKTTVSNKILAIVAEPKQTAEAAQEAVQARLMSIFESSIPTETRNAIGDEQMAVARKQIRDLNEFYWVAVPYDAEAYQACRERADGLLAARKNTRTFEPVTWGSSKFKSALDGKRESVLPEKHMHENVLNEGEEEKKRDKKEMYRLYRAKQGEQLSGVGLLKRLGFIPEEADVAPPKEPSKTAPFPSSSHMAAIPLSAQLAAATNVSLEWQAYIKALQGLDRQIAWENVSFEEPLLPKLGKADGSLLFAERLSDYLVEEPLRKAERALADFFENTKIDRPLAYYAILMGDGDYMGRAINKLETVDENRAFSQDLSEFAGQAGQTVNEHDGALVYAGGDDVVALLPVHTAVACGHQLAERFREQMGAYGSDEEPLTFSAGIAIVHHIYPLEDCLALARRAETKAKSIDGKNALAVFLDKRSGAVREVVGKWGPVDSMSGINDRMSGINDRLQRFAQLFVEQEIPGRMAYQIQDTMLLLGGKKAIQEDDELKKIAVLEAARLMHRKKDGGVAVTDETIEMMQEALRSTHEKSSFVKEIIIGKAISEALKLQHLQEATHA